MVTAIWSCMYKTKHCLRCRQEYTPNSGPQKYCSKCNPWSKKGPFKIVCNKCGLEFESSARNTKYCSQHRDEVWKASKGKNIEKGREYSRNYHKEHREECLAKMKRNHQRRYAENYEEEAEKSRLRNIKWRKENPEAARRAARKRNEKIRKGPVKISCLNCGKEVIRTANHQKFCPECSSYSRKGPYIIRCIECGKGVESKAYNRQYCEEHIFNNGMQKQRNNNRRARINGNGGTYTRKEISDIFEQQEGFCHYCGKLLYASFDSKIHIEHKVPIFRGGSNNIENIALSCATCNHKKGLKTDTEFLAIS